jgi:hypothetical protein
MFEVVFQLLAYTLTRSNIKAINISDYSIRTLPDYFEGKAQCNLTAICSSALKL